VVLCATQRGLRVLERVSTLLPGAVVGVCTFEEDASEPPFAADIEALAAAIGAPFLRVKRFGLAELDALTGSQGADLLLAAHWRYLLPPPLLPRFRSGAFVLHDSLLPSYRGFSPTVWAMVNGETRTGATLFEAVPAVDAGAIVGQEEVAIDPDETIADVMTKVTDAYLALVERFLPALVDGSAPRRPQDESRATYTCKRSPADNHIDWSAPTDRVWNLIRAVTAPYSGAYSHLDGARLTVWAAERVEPLLTYVGRVPGRVVEIRPGRGSVVLTGDGALLLSRLQAEGDVARNGDEILHLLSQTLT